MRPLWLPLSNKQIATHFMLTSSLIDTDEEAPPAIPVEQLLEYLYEDGHYKTCMELEARLRSFPSCRIIHKRLTSYWIMSYERTMKTITIVMEVAVDVMFRQCCLYLLQEKNDKAHRISGILLTESMWLSYHDVGRMFVEAWRDYVMQSRYGRYHPQQIVLKLHRDPVGINVVSYYKERLGIDEIINDDVVLDYYAFECEEIKKGTNLSRLTQSMQQLELGEHVNSHYVSIFYTLYRRLIVERYSFYVFKMSTHQQYCHQHQQRRGSRYWYRHQREVEKEEIRIGLSNCSRRKREKELCGIGSSSSNSICSNSKKMRKVKC